MTIHSRKSLMIVHDDYNYNYIVIHDHINININIIRVNVSIDDCLMLSQDISIAYVCLSAFLPAPLSTLSFPRINKRCFFLVVFLDDTYTLDIFLCVLFLQSRLS